MPWFPFFGFLFDRSFAEVDRRERYNVDSLVRRSVALVTDCVVT